MTVSSNSSKRASIAITLGMSLVIAALVYLLDGARLFAFGLIPVMAANMIRSDLGIVWASHKAAVCGTYAASLLWMLAVAYYVGSVAAGPLAGSWSLGWGR